MSVGGISSHTVHAGGYVGAGVDGWLAIGSRESTEIFGSNQREKIR
jgi:hypothetical protein